MPSKDFGANASTLYELLVRDFATGRKDWFEKFDDIPNRKTDTNNHGAFSSDNIGMNYDYPEADYERRAEIIQQHRDYQAGLLWFVTNDPRVPEDIRSKMATWGLAKDEFTDNGNWSHQIYVRESHCMIGEYVTTENDVLLKREVTTPGWNGFVRRGPAQCAAIHYTRRICAERRRHRRTCTRAYSISYGSIVPKKEECIHPHGTYVYDTGAVGGGGWHGHR